MSVQLAPASDLELSLGAWPGLSSADKDRVRAARAALVKALAGDNQSLAYLQTTSPATAAGKEAFSRALAVYAVHLAALPPQPASVASLPAPAPHPPTQAVPDGFAHLPAPPLAPHIVAPSPVGGVLVNPIIQAPVLLTGPGGPNTYPSSVTATVPGVTFPVSVGAPVVNDGGVMTGPPAAQDTWLTPAPASPAPLALVPGGSVATDTVAGAASPAFDWKLIAIAAVALFFLLGNDRK